MLNIASCYTELKDKPAAKKTLEALVAQYPIDAGCPDREGAPGALR